MKLFAISLMFAALAFPRESHWPAPIHTCDKVIVLQDDLVIPLGSTFADGGTTVWFNGHRQILQLPHGTWSIQECSHDGGYWHVKTTTYMDVFQHRVMERWLNVLALLHVSLGGI